MAADAVARGHSTEQVARLNVAQRELRVALLAEIRLRQSFCACSRKALRQSFCARGRTALRQSFCACRRTALRRVVIRQAPREIVERAGLHERPNRYVTAQCLDEPRP